MSKDSPTYGYMKNHSTAVIVAVILFISVAGLWWVKTQQAVKRSDTGEASTVIATAGMHAHPELTIYVRGEKIEIPGDIGIGAVHNPIHTHDDMPIVHLEFSGTVTANDIRLGKFFEVWGKDFRSFGQTVTMTVNGKPNTEFENYEMKDGDKIELRYE